MQIIGVVMRLEKLDSANKWFINQTYMDAINRYQTVIFPISTYTSLSYATSICDGLIIPGGYDIHSYYLQKEFSAKNTYYDTFMDHFDFTCIDAFYKAKKPILGICRGMQMINVYFHGSIIEDIDVSTHAQQNAHVITIEEKSFLSQLYPPKTVVNSYHHQVIGTLGTHITACAFSEEHYVEAIKHQEFAIYGVQWHPEKMDNDQILAYFLDIVCA